MAADTERLCENLSEVLARLAKVSDLLHGPEPRDASAAKAPAPVSSVRANINSAFQLIDRIAVELSRIEARL
jgi:hypothetical protein